MVFGVPSSVPAEMPSADDARANTNHLLWGGLYHMLKFVRKFVRDERGEDLMEYGLLVAFIATIALAVIITDPLGFGTAIQDAYQRAVDALNQA
jgi:Flp pilus assembly pilin Flp